jgi:hypothetical protein
VPTRDVDDRKATQPEYRRTGSGYSDVVRTTMHERIAHLLDGAGFDPRAAPTQDPCDATHLGEVRHLLRSPPHTDDHPARHAKLAGDCIKLSCCNRYEN